MSQETTIIIEIFSKLFASYNLLLMLVSIALNPLVFFICLKSKKLYSNNTFKLLAVASLNDIIACLPWNFEFFTNSFFGLQVSSNSLVYCRFVSVFIQYSSFGFASWLLVAISLDWLLSIRVKKWQKEYFDSSRPFIFSVILALIVLLINFASNFTVGYSLTMNDTEVIVCYSNQPDSFPWFTVISEILVYVGFIVPIGLLIAFSAYHIYKATRYRYKQNLSASSEKYCSAKGLKRKAQMTKVILVITFFYIVTSIVGLVVNFYLVGQIKSLDASEIVLNLANGVLFTPMAFKYFILYFSSKMFAQEAKRIVIKARHNRRVSTIPTRTIRLASNSSLNSLNSNSVEIQII